MVQWKMRVGTSHTSTWRGSCGQPGSLRIARPITATPVWRSASARGHCRPPPARQSFERPQRRDRFVRHLGARQPQGPERRHGGQTGAEASVMAVPDRSARTMRARRHQRRRPIAEGGAFQRGIHFQVGGGAGFIGDHTRKAGLQAPSRQRPAVRAASAPRPGSTLVSAPPPPAGARSLIVCSVPEAPAAIHSLITVTSSGVRGVLPLGGMAFSSVDGRPMRGEHLAGLGDRRARSPRHPCRHASPPQNCPAAPGLLACWRHGSRRSASQTRARPARIERIGRGLGHRFQSQLRHAVRKGGRAAASPPAQSQRGHQRHAAR